LFPWEHGSWGTLFFSKKLFLNERENSRKGSNLEPLGYKWGF
jgi:hypothetical protein